MAATEVSAGLQVHLLRADTLSHAAPAGVFRKVLKHSVHIRRVRYMALSDTWETWGPRRNKDLQKVRK